MKLHRVTVVTALLFLLLAVFPFAICFADPYQHFDISSPEPNEQFANKAAVIKIELWGTPPAGSTLPDKVELAFEWAGPSPELIHNWKAKTVLASPIVSRQELVNGYLIPLDKFPEDKVWRVRARWAASGAAWSAWVEFSVKKPAPIIGQLNTGNVFTPLGPVPKVASPLANAAFTENENIFLKADVSALQNYPNYQPGYIEVWFEKGGTGSSPVWTKSSWSNTLPAQDMIDGRYLGAASLELGQWRVKMRFHPDGAWSPWTQFKVYQNFDPNKKPTIIYPALNDKVGGDLIVKIDPNQVSQMVDVGLLWHWRVPTDSNWQNAGPGLSVLNYDQQKQPDGTLVATVPYEKLTPGVWMLEARSQAQWSTGQSSYGTVAVTGWVNTAFIVEGLTVPVIQAPAAGANVGSDAIPVRVAASKYKSAPVVLEFEHQDKGIWTTNNSWRYQTFDQSVIVPGTTIPLSKMGNLNGKWRVRAKYNFPGGKDAGFSPWVEFTVPLKFIQPGKNFPLP